VTVLRVPSRIDTARLTLRTWQPEHRPAFAAINADPAVMEHLGGTPMSRSDSDALVDRIVHHWQVHGFGLYAVEHRPGGEFAGFLGLSHHRALPDEVEIGWRLASSAWGRGLATEGATAVRDLAYGVLCLREIVSITIAANTRSIRVMEKLGLTYWREMAFEQWQLRIYRGRAPAAG
jgi:RimJ/RimL family protein N-acetyltransferase